MGLDSARALVVAIDGPSGSGKSTVSRGVARRLGAGYLDTGAMYRALTWACLEAGIDLSDQPSVARYAVQARLDVAVDPDQSQVTVDGTDITQGIRTERVTSRVSTVAANLDVRAELRRRQRALIREALGRYGAVVVEGRDITTVVAPDADVRILLTATEAARLARRAHDDHGRADTDALEATRRQVVDRDAADSAVSQFSTAAHGVITLDNSDLDVAQSVEAVLAIIAGAHEAG